MALNGPGNAAGRSSDPTALLNVGHGAPSTSAAAADNAQGEPTGQKKRRRKRKAKANRRQSFAVSNQEAGGSIDATRPALENTATTSRPSFYRLGQSNGGNLSNTSLASEALLDHREQPHMRARRDSRIPYNHDLATSHRAGYSNPFLHEEGQTRKQRSTRLHRSSGANSDADEGPSDARTPLLGKKDNTSTYGARDGLLGALGNKLRTKSNGSSISSRRRKPDLAREQSENHLMSSSWDVNNPPSVPNSPKLGADTSFDDVMVTDPYMGRSATSDRRKSAPNAGEMLIDIDGDAEESPFRGSTPSTPKLNPETRRHTMPLPAEGDVCFPVEGMSEIGDNEYLGAGKLGTRRRRGGREWPDLAVLEEWSREEKEVRSEGLRRKKISEPVLVGGRLRPLKNTWHRQEEDAPYRFTYFNEEFPSTIHSQTISELLQEGQGFRELFIPDPPELSDYSSDEDDDMTQDDRTDLSPHTEPATRHSSILGDPGAHSRERQERHSGDATPVGQNTQPSEKNKRYGSRPTFWLDVLSPTDTEMRVISKAFGIHPLTAEDILMREAREKVELFRNYYFVNYRTFEQDMNNEDYLEPVDMYVVVFRDGVISFHFSQTPHPANVRRRIRQLKDYLILSADWISYAIIDDITDVFAPLIQSIEEEVDNIDDAILDMHTSDSSKEKSDPNNEKRSDNGEAHAESGGDMLKRVGQGRKKVMGLYRLLGNKADVIKGFAKRCNEQWEIAPRSEIGLYLGDIQDHILTMTSNLSHYETLLSRAHSNYLAQINIRMNERQEQTADVLGKLTVLGTIVLPMNIITGMWGMNVLVPGQDTESLYWFWAITAGLFGFGLACFFIAKRVYGIV